jgi:hypothetical protein
MITSYMCLLLHALLCPRSFAFTTFSKIRQLKNALHYETEAVADYTVQGIRNMQLDNQITNSRPRCCNTSPQCGPMEGPSH